MWKAPASTDLQDIIANANNHLIICSPFIKKEGLDIVASALSHTLSNVEIWTRLDINDYLVGASDPDSLLDFITDIGAEKVNLFHGGRLHSKFILSDQGLALAGSANLTNGGFRNNIELIRRINDPSEILELVRYTRNTRPLLTNINFDYLKQFVTDCLIHSPDREALSDLIRTAIPQSPTTNPLVPLSEFIRFVNSEGGVLADQVRTIYFNSDHNNRTGHLKQGYYAVQRFLQEHPEYIEYIKNEETITAFDPQSSSHLLADWVPFLQSHQAETDESFDYSFHTLIGYLTPQYGGIRTGGGGGDYPFKLVWPFVARMMSSTQ